MVVVLPGGCDICDLGPCAGEGSGGRGRRQAGLAHKQVSSPRLYSGSSGGAARADTARRSGEESGSGHMTAVHLGPPGAVRGAQPATAMGRQHTHSTAGAYR